MPSRKVAHTGAPWLVIALTLLAGAPATANESAAPPSSGTWSISSSGPAGQVDFGIAARTEHSDWEERATQPIANLRGLSLAQLAGSGQKVHFVVVRDPGTFDCVGWAARGSGAGTFTYAASAQFVSELESRGMAAPTPMQQFELMIDDISLAYVDELRRAGYEPTTDGLIEMADHGVTRNYVETVSAAGYRPGSIDELIGMRDHGVTPEYLVALRSAGLNATLNQAIEMRDHGVSADFAKGVRQLGYSPTVEQLIALRDHGVNLEYIRHVRQAGYRPSLEDLIRMRDAGI